jgi:hypothetical protein
MTRLFTFGCSFTKYNWPTWADFINIGWVEYYNWGHPGIGNRAIAERIAEAHALYKFTKDDLVIVQWSSYVRHDYARPDIPSADCTMWKTRGNIFSSWNSKVFDKKWINTFWNEPAYYIHTLNNVILVQELLKGIGCYWFMTASTDLQDYRLKVPGVDENSESDNSISLWDMDPTLTPYKERIWEDNNEHWFPPILTEKWNSPDLNWQFDIDKQDLSALDYFKTSDTTYTEPHLTSLQYHNYLKNNRIYELFNIDEKYINNNESIALYIEDLKEEAGTDMQCFFNLLTANDVIGVNNLLRGR